MKKFTFIAILGAILALVGVYASQFEVILFGICIAALGVSQMDEEFK